MEEEITLTGEKEEKDLGSWRRYEFESIILSEEQKRYLKDVLVNCEKAKNTEGLVRSIKRLSTTCRTLLVLDELNREDYIKKHPVTQYRSEINRRGGTVSEAQQICSMYKYSGKLENCLTVWYRNKPVDLSIVLDTSKLWNGEQPFKLRGTDKFNLAWIAGMNPISDSAKLKANVLLDLDQGTSEKEIKSKYGLSDNQLMNMKLEYGNLGMQFIINDCNPTRQADIKKRIHISDLITESTPIHEDLGWTIEDVKMQLKDRYGIMVSSTFVETVVHQIGYNTEELEGWQLIKQGNK